MLAAVTQPEDNVVTAELSERARAVKSIVETYLWALTLDKKSFIDFDFVLEIHARMFGFWHPCLNDVILGVLMVALLQTQAIFLLLGLERYAFSPPAMDATF